MDCSPPGSSVHGIFQARILEWIVIFSSMGRSRCMPNVNQCSFHLLRLLMTEIKATRFKSVTEKAFYSDYHLHPGEIWIQVGWFQGWNVVSLGTCSVQVMARYYSNPWPFWEKRGLWNEMEGKEFSTDGQFPECSGRDSRDWIPFLLLHILVEWNVDLNWNSCWEPLVPIHEDWEIHISRSL